jgi:hypothetical protein
MATAQQLWAMGVAARLRLAYLAAADAPVAERADLYRSEIDRAVSNLPREEHQAYLKVLRDRFPAWGFELATNAPAPVVANTPAEPKTPMESLADFIAGISRLTNEQRTEALEQLQEAGIVPPVVAPTAAGPDMELKPDVARKLGFPERGRVNADRLSRLTGDLMDFAEKVDKWMWQSWKQAHPRSTFNKTHSDLKTLATKALNGESINGGHGMSDALGRTSKLVGGFLGGFSSGLNGFSEDLWQRFTPPNIEADVQGFLGKKDKCWDRYCQVFKDYSTWQILENQIRSRITRDVEQIITAKS